MLTKEQLLQEIKRNQDELCKTIIQEDCDFNKLASSFNFEALADKYYEYFEDVFLKDIPDNQKIKIVDFNEWLDNEKKDIPTIMDCGLDPYLQEIADINININCEDLKKDALKKIDYLLENSAYDFDDEYQMEEYDPENCDHLRAAESYIIQDFLREYNSRVMLILQNKQTEKKSNTR
ncbi:hypothetical protein [Mycoplasmopsis pullorum]|uniref:Uncharacterized protein n=1 Tax=Mycoplasmopsis pullorum TaxID=48003 RepID=A0A1L4FS10_9BACT|nr:hypothetical protein [Mycoplasmopsis pullorum]APJ38382.1 hypothetical protein BLA55_01690 [Mycoplasmopsis pullorum]